MDHFIIHCTSRTYFLTSLFVFQVNKTSFVASVVTLVTVRRAQLSYKKRDVSDVVSLAEARQKIARTVTVAGRVE